MRTTVLLARSPWDRHLSSHLHPRIPSHLRCFSSTTRIKTALRTFLALVSCLILACNISPNVHCHVSTMQQWQVACHHRKQFPYVDSYEMNF